MDKKKNFKILNVKYRNVRKDPSIYIGDKFISFNKQFCIDYSLDEGDLIKFGIDEDTRTAMIQLKADKNDPSAVFAFHQRRVGSRTLCKQLRDVVGRRPRLVFNEEEGWLELYPVKE